MSNRRFIKGIRGCQIDNTDSLHLPYRFIIYLKKYTFLLDFYHN